MRRATAEKYSPVLAAHVREGPVPALSTRSRRRSGSRASSGSSPRRTGAGSAFSASCSSTTLAILLANRTSKAEYLAASFAPLLAAGGVALERVLHRGRSAVARVGLRGRPRRGRPRARALATPAPPGPAVPRVREGARRRRRRRRNGTRSASSRSTSRTASAGPRWPPRSRASSRTLPEAERKTARVWRATTARRRAVDSFGRALGVPPVALPAQQLLVLEPRGREAERALRGSRSS